MKSFEEFQKENGWKYPGKGEAEEAYLRRVRVSIGGEVLSEDEFILEAGKNYDVETLKNVYARLIELVTTGKLSKNEILAYATYKWCLRDVKTLVACLIEPEHWEVNNCGSEIEEEQAIIQINREWGFEASRIEIQGIPYYEATDYQFIRFSCAHAEWLWKNGELYSVCEL